MSTPIAHHYKAPGDVLDYDVDMSEWLDPTDTIQSVAGTIAAISATSTIALDSTENDDTSVKAWVSGGAAGEVSKVTMTAVTANGRTKVVCLKFTVKEC